MRTTKTTTNTKYKYTDTSPSFVHGFSNDGSPHISEGRQTHGRPQCSHPAGRFTQQKHITRLFTLVTLNVLPKPQVTVVTSDL